MLGGDTSLKFQAAGGVKRALPGGVRLLEMILTLFRGVVVKLL